MEKKRARLRMMMGSGMMAIMQAMRQDPHRTYLLSATKL